MTLRIGINGFGRIGRTVLRAAMHPLNKDIEIVHINSTTDPKSTAHLLKYDSVHGTFQADVKTGENAIYVNDKLISLSSTRDPREIPWKDKNIDIVFECTGAFKSNQDNMMHIAGGAKKVLISAPGDADVTTIVYGVNEEVLKKSDLVVSNGSCTTNCLAPMTKVIHNALGIKKGLMTTVHSYTNDQKILDVAHKDLRRARAGAMNMIPTSTGAAKAIGLVIPELKGKIDGFAIRVPTPNVSVVDVTFEVEKMTSKEEVNELLKNAANGPLKGIIGYTEEPLVSSDFNGATESSIIDASVTKVLGGNMVKVLTWYDNETGFSWRMLDVARLMR